MGTVNLEQKPIYFSLIILIESTKRLGRREEKVTHLRTEVSDSIHSQCMLHQFSRQVYIPLNMNIACVHLVCKLCSKMLAVHYQYYLVDRLFLLIKHNIST